MPNDFGTPENVKCPWCGKMQPFVPHLSKPGREAAYCDCRGEALAFMERPAQKARYAPKKDGE